PLPRRAEPFERRADPARPPVELAPGEPRLLGVGARAIEEEAVPHEIRLLVRPPAEQFHQGGSHPRVPRHRVLPCIRPRPPRRRCLLPKFHRSDRKEVRVPTLSLEDVVNLTS